MRTGHGPEQIIRKLRDADRMLSADKALQAARIALGRTVRVAQHNHARA